MAGLNDFAKRMRQHGKRVEENSNMLKRKAALAVDATVVLATPVDEGRARANWQAALGAPASGTLPPYAPGSNGSSGAANATAAINQAKAVVRGSKPEQAIHITNNLPYIGRLNEGWSAQAPAGFVQTAVLRGIAAIRGAATRIVSGRITDGN